MIDVPLPAMFDNLPVTVRHLIDVAIAAGLAVVLHGGLFRLMQRLTARSQSRSDKIVLRRLKQPIGWLLVALAVGIARRGWRLNQDSVDIWHLIEGLMLPLLIGWTLIAILRALRDVVELHADISVEDNLEARRRRTRTGILVRIGIFLIVLVTVAMMLLSLPSVRSIGVSLLASAGLAGLAVGAAAQPALKNLIAGIQMAFTEPIRIDDAVIIADEWGWIEDIRLTYVVVKLWDERRLIVPVSKFLEEPFQNWTRKGAGLLGSVFFYLDPTADVDRLRAYFESFIQDEPLFDGRGKVVQVTDMTADAIELRILATASNSPRTFDLRCAIREKMLAFIRDEMPEALPRHRALVEPEGALRTSMTPN